MSGTEEDPEERLSWAGGWEVETLGSPWIELPPGLLIPTWVRGTSRLSRTDLEGIPEGERLFVMLRATYADRDGRYSVHEIVVESIGPNGIEVTGSILRALPIQRFLREVVLTAATPNFEIDFGPEVVQWFQGRAGGPTYPTKTAKRRPSSPDTMRDVAAVYRGAEITNDPPVRAVEEAFRLERHTALYWIRKAREGGVLAVRA